MLKVQRRKEVTILKVTGKEEHMQMKEVILSKDIKLAYKVCKTPLNSRHEHVTFINVWGPVHFRMTMKTKVRIHLYWTIVPEQGVMLSDKKQDTQLIVINNNILVYHKYFMEYVFAKKLCSFQIKFNWMCYFLFAKSSKFLNTTKISFCLS